MSDGTTEQDLAELRALGSDLSASAASHREPRCIAGAFARSNPPADFVLTMQGWIDLEAIDSPILDGLAPEGDDCLEQIRAALPAFNHPAFDPLSITPEEAAAIVACMIAAVRKAFSLCLRMVDPRASGGSSDRDGFGTWLPIYTCLITQCHLGIAEADALPVYKAFALIATMRRNDGWKVAGMPYVHREI